MSYTVTLSCGCRVYVACHPVTGLAHTRVLEERPARCGVRSHDVGVRVPLWEVLPYEPEDPYEIRREPAPYRRVMGRVQ